MRAFGQRKGWPERRHVRSEVSDPKRSMEGLLNLRVLPRNNRIETCIATSNKCITTSTSIKDATSNKGVDSMD